MNVIRKRIVSDEANNPVAVMIPYEDWIEIERLLEEVKFSPKGQDLSRHNGTMTLTEDPLGYQSRLRAEWH